MLILAFGQLTRIESSDACLFHWLIVIIGFAKKVLACFFPNVVSGDIVECLIYSRFFIASVDVPQAIYCRISIFSSSETSTCHICHKEYKDLYHHVKVGTCIMYY
jgi:hypothetical protein